MQPEVEGPAETVVENNGRSFSRTTWNEISVIKDVETGYYKASKACEDNNKPFRHWLVNKGTREYLQLAAEEYGLSTEPAIGGTAEFRRALLFEIDSHFDNDFRGYYIHPKLFHDVCYWANKRYALKVSHLMDLLNERNKRMHQTLEQTINQLEDQLIELEIENDHKKTVLDALETELISRAETIEQQAETIKDLTTPINQLAEPPIIYAKPVGDDSFQLKYAKQPIGPRIATLRRLSVVNAKDILKQVLKTLRNNGTATKQGQRYIIDRTNLDSVFNLISTIKDGRDDSLINHKNEVVDKELERLQGRRQTPQIIGRIFEMNYIKDNGELIPWTAVPSSILNNLNETRKDTGIDAVVINGGTVIEIVQIKSHMNTYLRRDEIDTFLSKSAQARYANVRKRLVIHNCKIGKGLRRDIEALGIELEII